MAGPTRRKDKDNKPESDFGRYFSEELEGQDKTYAQSQPPSLPSDIGSDQPVFEHFPDPSFDEVVDTLFVKSFKRPKSSSTVTSGDPDTDRAIDLAVETLFVEEPEAAPPETTEVEAKAILSLDSEIESMAATVARNELGLGHPPKLEPSLPEEPRLAVRAPRVETPSYQQSIESLVRLQEAILTLEWEVSERSVKTLIKELQLLREQFPDDVTVDFAALAMRVVLNYVVKRMSRAHPESIRFLLDVTGFLRGSLASSNHDSLVVFHQILTRYERYKTIVRRAEGIPDAAPPILERLQIQNPDAFLRLVEHQVATLSKASQSLATRIASLDDRENFIRSFRFLVTRAFNRILESTIKEKPSKATKKKRSSPG